MARERDGLGGLEAIALEVEANALRAVDIRRPDQPALARERGWRDVVARGERVPRRRDDDEPTAKERHGCDGCLPLRARPGTEGDVGAALLEQVGERLARHRLDG